MQNRNRRLIYRNMRQCYLHQFKKNVVETLLAMLASYWYITNYPIFQRHKTTSIISQFSESFILWYRMCHRAAIKVSAEAAVIGGRIFFHSDSNGFGRSQVLAGCWLQTSVSCHMSISIILLKAQQRTSSRVNDSMDSKRQRGKMELKQSFCNLISELTSYYFSYILLSEASHQVQATFI